MLVHLACVRPQKTSTPENTTPREGVLGRRYAHLKGYRMVSDQEVKSQGFNTAFTPKFESRLALEGAGRAQDTFPFAHVGHISSLYFKLALS